MRTLRQGFAYALGMSLFLILIPWLIKHTSSLIPMSEHIPVLWTTLIALPLPLFIAGILLMAVSQLADVPFR